MSLLENRKAIAFFVTAFITIILKQLGLSPVDVQNTFGVSWSDVQSVAVDIVWSGLLPAWVGWAWPNDPAAGILDYWKVALSGAGFIVILAFVIWLL